MTTTPPPPASNQPSPPGPTVQPPSGGGKRVAVVATLLIVIAGLATAAGLVLVNRGDDVAESPEYVTVDIPSTTPVFEPAAARGNDPFFPLEVQLQTFQEEVEDELDDQVAAALENAEPGETVTRPEFDVEALDAAVKTGLYGGTEENTCDPERLISFLYANPDLGEAWAKVQGIEFSEIAEYIRGLDIRILAEDVNVLNHGYNATTGSAYEIDTVLAAGTAVLVDQNGDIRTRCYCGNPIRPKPPQHMPPRCLVYGTLVYAEPAGTERRKADSQDVLLTGKQATNSYGGTWIEVKWGTDDDQKGWVPSQHLRKYYCPTPTSDRYCPGPDAVQVWHTPDSTDAVGHVTGQVRTVDTTLDVFAPINPVGGIGSETIINDFMLIRFTEASPSIQNSAWVKLADLNQDSTACQRIPQCINTNGPVLDRAGGVPIGGLDQVLRVEFTGHFAGETATHAEVRLLDGSGTYGWVANLFYTPLADAECDRPIYDCVEYGFGYATSDPSDLDAIAQLANTRVVVVDGPENGRVQVELAQGGPRVWVDATSLYDGYDYCEPYPFCAITTGTAWSEFPTNGVSLAPLATATFIEDRGQMVQENPGDPIYLLIGVGGNGYWIEIGDVQGVPLEECYDVDIPECPQFPYASPVDDYVAAIQIGVPDESGTEMRGMAPGDDAPMWSQCCVAALYGSPDLGMAPVTTVPTPVLVAGELVDLDGTVWYVTADAPPQYFLAIDVVPSSACDAPECPPAYPGGYDEQDIYDNVQSGAGVAAVADNDTQTGAAIVFDDGYPGITPPQGDPSTGCCVSALYSSMGTGMIDTGGSAVLVEVAFGPVGNGPAWYRTVGGAWFTDTAVVDADNCQPVSCPTGPNTLPPNRIGDPTLDELYDSAQLIAAYYPGDQAGCCVDADVLDSPGGDVVVYSNDGPFLVNVIGIGPDSYLVIIPPDGLFGHVDGADFVDLEDCLPGDGGGDCPQGSLTRTAFLGAGEVLYCCISIDGDAGQEFVEGAFSGFSRTAPDGGREFEPLAEPGAAWVAETRFVDAGDCGPSGECPTFSVINANDPFTCCVKINGEAQEVMLTGEVDDLGGGVFDYTGTDGRQYLTSDFIDGPDCDEPEVVTPPACQGTVVNGQCCVRPNEVVQNQCVPRCASGQVRTTSGDCETPTPTPTPTACPEGQSPNAAGQCVPNTCTDADQDTICDTDDNCVRSANRDQADADNDGDGDACDPCTDADRDLFCENPNDPANDNCWGVGNSDQSDADQDGRGDACDNCPSVPNDQTDTDADGVGDACECPTSPLSGGDGDIDDDGICDGEDNCPAAFNPGQADSDDTDGHGDACDNCPTVFNPAQADTGGVAGVGDACDEPDCGQGDDDGDGVCNGDDNCVSDPNPGQENADGDQWGNACDLCVNLAQTSQNDTDGDGWGDGCDFCVVGGVVQSPADDRFNPDQGFIYDNEDPTGNDSCFSPLL